MSDSKLAAENALGLDLQNLAIEDDLLAVEPGSGQNTHGMDPATLPDDDDDSNKPEKRKKPYINTDRYLTGSNPRDKPSDEELADRMTRIREQNEKIKQRRVDVQKDEDAFKQTQEEERAKQARTRKLQANVDEAREQNARRKLEKAQAREWDSGKEQPKSNPKPEPEFTREVSVEPEQSPGSSQWQRGTGARGGPPRGGRGTPRGGGGPLRETGDGSPRATGSPRGGDRGDGRGRSRGRGRGRGGPPGTTSEESKPGPESANTPPLLELKAVNEWNTDLSTW